MTSRIQKVLNAEKERLQRGRKRLDTEDSDSASAETSGASRLLRRILSVDPSPASMRQYRILPAIEDKQATTAYRMLRTRVQQRMRSNGWSSLLVTGAESNDGKTITASNLAISVAKEVNRSAILVDMDMRRPSLAEYFGLEVTAGLGDYLRGDAAIEQIVYVPEGLERLLMIPNRAPIDDASDLINSPRMQDLVQWTREQSSDGLTIYDMPPVLATDDVLAFSELVDAVLLVVSQGQTERRQLEKALELLANHELLGVVLNRSTNIQVGTYGEYY